MGYQQQQEMVEQPQAPIVIEVPASGGDALVWATGVVVPLIVAVLGALAARRSAYYAAFRNTDKGKAFRQRVGEEITRRAVARIRAGKGKNT